MLIPYARNARTHSDEQVAQIAASIREFGFTNPVLIDGEGGIIAGHGRVMAARKLAMDKVQCIRLAHLTEAQRRAYVIADNKLALNAGWDDAMLALEFKELQELGFDVELTGFSLGDIDELLAELDATPEGATGADETPAVQAEAVSKPGESVFSKVFLIRPSVFAGTPGVSDPKADFSYPYAVEHDGKLYIGYTHKSHAANELAVIPVSSLAD